jgi:hypothetical protein
MKAQFVICSGQIQLTPMTTEQVGEFPSEEPDIYLEQT